MNVDLNISYFYGISVKSKYEFLLTIHAIKNSFLFSAVYMLPSDF